MVDVISTPDLSRAPPAPPLLVVVCLFHVSSGVAITLRQRRPVSAQNVSQMPPQPFANRILLNPLPIGTPHCLCRTSRIGGAPLSRPQPVTLHEDRIKRLVPLPQILCIFTFLCLVGGVPRREDRTPLLAIFLSPHTGGLFRASLAAMIKTIRRLRVPIKFGDTAFDPTRRTQFQLGCQFHHPNTRAMDGR